MFKISQLSFSYNRKKELLKQINFETNQRVIGIIGKNGTGKSTMLKLISRELTPDSGEITYLGRSYRSVYNFNYYKRFSLEELLDLLKELESFSIDKLDYYLSGLNLLDFLEEPLEQLSQGTYKKVGLLFSLLSDAELLLLDEPFESLDNPSTQFIIKVIKETSRRVIIVEHDLSAVNELCQAVLDLDEW